MSRSWYDSAAPSFEDSGSLEASASTRRLHAFGTASIPAFLEASPEAILGTLTLHATFPVEAPQRGAWMAQVNILKATLTRLRTSGAPRPGAATGFSEALASGALHFEYSIPRMGRRIDAVLVLGSVLFVIEFKVCEREFTAHALDQVVDYALDLKNFHATSHRVWIVPVLVSTGATEAPDPVATVQATRQAERERLLPPIRANADTLAAVVEAAMGFCEGDAIAAQEWAEGSYHPTPTIVEAAVHLYREHKVEEKDSAALSVGYNHNLGFRFDYAASCLRHAQ